MIMCSDTKFIFYTPESFKNTSCYKKRNKKLTIQDFNSFTLWKTIQFRLNFNKRERNFNKKNT